MIASSAGSFGAVVGVIIAFVFATWSYRWTKPPAPAWLRLLLAALRGLALAGVWLLAVGFELRVTRTVPRTTRVAVLLDRSASMTAGDANETPADLARSLVRNLPDPPEGRRAQYALFGFSQTLEAVKSAGDLGSFDGPLTDLEGALTALERRPGTPDAVILLSDGAVNRGGDGRRAADRLDAPVFAVGLGDSSVSRNVAVNHVSAPATAYSGEEIEVTATVLISGAEGETVGVQLVGEQGQVWGRAEVRAEGDWAERRVSFVATLDEPGVRTLRVEAGTLEGETGAEDNRRRVAVRIADRRRRVLLLAGRPSPDAAAVARALEADPDTEARILVAGGHVDRLLRGSWTAQDSAGVFDAAVLLLHGPFGPRARSVLQAVVRADLPSWIVTGAEPDEQAISIAAPLAGALRPASAPGERPVLPVGGHALLSDAGGWLERRDGALPPLQLPPLQPVEGDVVGRTPEGWPVVTALREGGRRSVVFAAGELARWQFAAGGGETGERLVGLAGRIMRWLTAQDEGERVTVEPDRDLVLGGQTVTLIARVRDQALRPAHDARVSATVTGAGRERTVSFRHEDAGRYEGRLTPWGAGRYQVRAQVRVNGESLTRSSSFVVDDFSLEAVDARLRPGLLRDLARETGGAFLLPEEWSTLSERIRWEKGVEQARSTWRPFGLWRTLLAIALLLAAEWIVRVRRGML